MPTLRHIPLGRPVTDAMDEFTRWANHCGDPPLQVRDDLETLERIAGALIAHHRNIAAMLAELSTCYHGGHDAETCAEYEMETLGVSIEAADVVKTLVKRGFREVAK